MADRTHLRRPLPLPVGEWRRAPLSVWVTGQTDPLTQLADGYVPDTAADHQRISPAVAAHAIAHYTRPGGLVVDPDCGTGTALVEALRAGRHAVGVTTSRRSWETARANLTACKRAGAFTDGMVLDTVANPGARVDHLAGLAGRVDLVLTTARPHPQRHGAVRDLAAVFAGVVALLRADGHLVLAVPRVRRGGQLDDIAGAAVAAAQGYGLVAVDRCVALLAEVRGNRLITRACLAQRRAARAHERAMGHPICLPAHQDLLVFRPTSTTDTAVGDRPAEPVRPAAPAPVVHRDDVAVLCAA